MQSQSAELIVFAVPCSCRSVYEDVSQGGIWTWLLSDVPYDSFVHRISQLGQLVNFVCSMPQSTGELNLNAQVSLGIRPSWSSSPDEEQMISTLLFTRFTVRNRILFLKLAAQFLVHLGAWRHCFQYIQINLRR